MCVLRIQLPVVPADELSVARMLHSIPTAGFILILSLKLQMPHDTAELLHIGSLWLMVDGGWLMVCG
jgi:hypothetical protein